MNVSNNGWWYDGRVLHVIPYLWSGAGDVVTRLAAAQAGRHRVMVATSPAVGSLRDWPAYRRRLNRASVAHATVETFARAPERFWTAVDAMQRLFRTFRPDVVHCHAGVPALVAACATAATSGDRRLVGQFYNWRPGRPTWMNVMDCHGFGRMDALVCSARASVRLLRRHGVRGPITMVPLGLAPSFLRPITLAPVQFGRQTVGFVGRIEPRKQQHVLIEALAVLRRTRSVDLELIGEPADPTYLESLQSLTLRWDLGDRVRFAGHIRSVTGRVAGWSAFVSASIDEGQGLAVLEAMALGTPVVARRAPGLEDFLVDGRNAVVASPGARALVRGIARVLDDDRLRARLIVGGRRLVERRFTWDRTLHLLSSVYAGGSR
ncbi:MAG: glycosyltransferase family 4 protein [Vicinamibacteraceae bacterium]|nr:glycosyltransferase family 4 protein [Vicinamibacteraceae bacterium]